MLNSNNGWATRMKRSGLLIILLAVILLTAGCIENSLNFQGNSVKGTVTQVTQLEQINTSLQKTPVFLKIGAKWCPSCRSMKPILEKLAAEYAGNITVEAIDIDQSPELSKYFEVKHIPDSCVIIGLKNGTYIYMQEDGNISVDRSKARLIGLNETVGPDEKTFEKVINLALQQKAKGF